MKKAKKEFESKLAKRLKRTNFFLYMPGISKSKVKVGLLKDSQGELTSKSKVKAEMLNDFFSTVFTIENK